MKKTKNNWKKIVGISVVFVILAVFVFGRFGGRHFDEFGGFDGDFKMMNQEMAFLADTEDMAMGFAPGADLQVRKAGGSSVQNVDRQIIKNGNLSLIVVDVETAVDEIKVITDAQEGGFVEGSFLEELTDDTQIGWIRIRVPAENFDVVMESIKNIAAEVESENVNADDVTRQVTDSEARLVNLRAEETQFREILDKVKTVEEILMTTEHLNRVRWEIESVETQLRNVKEEVALSTIFVNLVDEGDVEIFGIHWRPLVNLKQSLRGALENVTSTVDFLVAFLVNVPLILVWIFLLSMASWLIWKVGGRIWKRISK